MIVDPSTDLPATVAADVVIAGAGTVGLFVAQYLVRQGFRVAVIEAGDRIAQAASDGNGAQAIGKPHDGLRMGRAFGLGGTSTLWGGQLAEFQPADLRHPEAPWPIDWNELQSLYAGVFAELGLPPRAPDAEWRQKLGVNLPLGALEHFYTTWLPQPNFSALWGKLLRESDRLSVYLQQTAVQTHFEGARCVAIDAMGPGRRRTRFQGRQFLLALGTIGNAQFCLTQKAHESTPFRSNPHVGAWFHDHLGGKLGDLRITDEKRFRQWFENGFAGGYKLQPKLRFTRRPDSADGLGVCGFFGFRSLQSGRIDEAKQLIRTLRNGVHHTRFWRLPLDLLRVASTLAPLALRYLSSRRVLAMFDDGVDFLVQAEQLPIRESAIRAVPGRQTATGLVEVAVDWRLSGREANAVRQFLHQATDYFSQTGLGQLVPNPALLGDDALLLDCLSDTYHQCGGLRMSHTPSTGVTTADGRIWSTENLRVLGASVLPSSSYANCTLTALATSLKAAQTTQENL